MTVKDPGDWTETNTSTSFFKPQVGNNIFRIVSKPRLTLSHWIKVGANNTTMKVGCMERKEDCPICSAGVPLLSRHTFLVLDKKDGSVKLYEAPSQVYQAIKAFAIDPDYGDPKQYDIKLIREGTGLSTKYQVVANPKKKPLEEEDMEKIKEAEEGVDWKKLYPQKTATELQDLVDNFSDEFKEEVAEKVRNREQQQGKAEAKTNKPRQPVTVVSSVSKEEEDDFFAGIPEKDDFNPDDLDWGGDV